MSRPGAASKPTGAGGNLRARVRDLVALSAMPASWIGRKPGAIAESACDLLIRVLDAQVAYVQVWNSETKEYQASAVGASAAEVESRLERDDRTGTLGSVPLGINGELGRLAAESVRPGFPNETDSLLLQLAANQIAVALRYAGLLARHQQAEQLLCARAMRQAATAGLGLRALTNAVDEVLEGAVQLGCEMLHADYCEVFELAPTGNSLVLRASAGWPRGLVGHGRAGSGRESQAGYTLLTGDPVVVPDLRQETRFAACLPLGMEDAVSGLTVIIHEQPRPFGVLGVHTREPRDFLPDDVHFLQSVANLLTAALQRYRAEAEQEKALVQIRRAMAGRDRAIGIVSHDLGNLLSTIDVCATALLDRAPPPLSGIRHMAQIIQRSTGYMQQIVQDLLDRASLDAGRLALERQPTAVSDLIGAAQVVFAPVAEEHALDFVVDTADDLPWVDADPRRLLQVLGNLVSNALKFTPAGGRVVLSARHAEPELGSAGTGQPGRLLSAVRFTVSDTGPGISAPDLAHVFDWFWQSKPGSQSGTGLGLAIAKGLIEAHRSRLEVESVPGEGTTFWFTMPAVGAEM